MKGGWKLIRITNRGYEVLIDISLSFCLLNASNTAVNLSRLKAAIDKSISQCYNVTFFDSIFETYFTKGGLDNYPSQKRIFERKLLHRVHVTINSRIVSAAAQRQNSEHLIQIRNLSPGLYGAADFIGGSTVSINSRYIPDIIRGSDRNTIPHELGHTLSLMHVDENYHFFASFGGTSDQYCPPPISKSSSTQT